MDEQISPRTKQIITMIGRGKCTLFLGAGASLSSGAPTGDDLSNLIIKTFLDLEGWPMSVDHAFSLALANRSVADIESFVRSKLSVLQPSDSHRILPWFKWRALITTNYDVLIEKAYEAKVVTQQLALIHTENDLPKVGLSLEEYVPLLKPHGCISSSQEMLLGIEGIHDAKRKRRLIFSYIEMLHLAGPVIYIGYSLRDGHIIDMLCELKDRLGGRTDILFVTRHEEGRNAIERRWFQTKLGVEFLDWGFEGFMTYLSEKLTPQIGPSKIVPQLTSCRVLKFGEKLSYKIGRSAPGQWECWLDYTINDPEGFVGIIFQTTKPPLDLSQYDLIRFEINFTESPRQKKRIEAIKLEGYNRVHTHPIDLSKLTANRWEWVTIPLDKFKRSGARTTAVRQVVFTDTGSLAVPRQSYKVGIRNVEFYKPPGTPDRKLAE